MNKEGSLFVTCDLLQPHLGRSCRTKPTVGYQIITWIMGILDKQEIKARSLWKSAITDIDLWIRWEHTPEVIEPYLDVVPDLLQSASCVVGWELPNGLRSVLESHEILWVSFTHYLWTYRSDILSVESNDTSLLKAIHRPVHAIQPMWTLDHRIPASSFLIVEPPEFHCSRIHNGKVYTLDDCSDEILNTIENQRALFVFPQLVTQPKSAVLALVGFHTFSHSSFTLYLSSNRIGAVASLDPSVVHATEAFHKPFYSWSSSYHLSALISYRHLQSREVWQEICSRARPIT